MANRMKTTIEITDSLLEDAKAVAAEEGTTLRALVESGLRWRVAEHRSHYGIFNRDVGTAYRKSILAVGGSRPALESFVEFRGRAPKPDALLRSYGLAA